MYTVCTLRSCQFPAEFFFINVSNKILQIELASMFRTLSTAMIAVKTFILYNFKDLYNTIPKSKLTVMYIQGLHENMRHADLFTLYIRPIINKPGIG